MCYDIFLGCDFIVLASNICSFIVQFTSNVPLPQRLNYIEFCWDIIRVMKLNFTNKKTHWTACPYALYSCEHLVDL